ncbi:MAG TPA: GNAT family N-acetyltransferase [Chitinophagaceae bacterium]|nr:GNAT family N-acetyltransferase [Chitinophagaceae bacterium]
MQIEWKCQSFDRLTVDDLYAILRLRSEVFVVEQNCVFLDMDDKDQQSWHACGWHEDRLIAYTRLVPPGLAYAEPSIGRVVTSPSVRKAGVGRKLMEYSIEKIFSLFGKQPIKIGAQLYLKSFYESLGFRQSSEVYLEDGIEHIEMCFPILEN